KVLWKTEKAMPSFGSPMVHKGLAYWVNNVGVLYCFDAVSGELVYTKRSGQLCWATPLGLGDHIYLFGKDGLTTVIAAGREFKVVARNELIEGATEAGEADVRRRESQGHQHGGGASGETTSSQPAGDSAAGTNDQAGRSRRGGRPAGSSAEGSSTTEPDADAEQSPRRGGRPGESSGGSEAQGEGGAPRTRDGLTFADPVQYGYAAVNGSLVIRTGGKVYCVRTSAKTAEVSQ
ncbi:MAG: hypothetical protein KDA66_13545, partial [Planctomycetaceae bacterium]|nr:hypothetical protein [Planctomycetaceae bacterium]